MRPLARFYMLVTRTIHRIVRVTWSFGYFGVANDWLLDCAENSLQKAERAAQLFIAKELARVFHV